VIKARRVRWAEHVERIGELRNAYNVFVGKLQGKDQSEKMGLNWSIILDSILGK
jgi:hypothetical protein